VTAAIIMSAALGYGFYRLGQNDPGASFKITVVQANIPQSDKWNPQEWPPILEKYLSLSQKALAAKPNLIIWPETAFPGFLWDAPGTYARVKAFVAQARVPLLFGVITEENDRYYNSVVLLGSSGQEILRHHKMHLVPFGEYIPLADVLPLRKILPVFSDRVPMADFSAGERATIFPSPVLAPDRKRTAGYFSVLICFEDSVSAVARKFVRAGANLLINVTNDAWFLDTNEPFLHLQTAVFRSVENRRTLVRAANTGVSCFIDPHGRVYNVLRNAGGRQTYISGFSAARVKLSARSTFYTRFGDIFVLGCLLMLAAVFLRKKIRPGC